MSSKSAPGHGSSLGVWICLDVDVLNCGLWYTREWTGGCTSPGNWAGPAPNGLSSGVKKLGPCACGRSIALIETNASATVDAIWDIFRDNCAMLRDQNRHRWKHMKFSIALLRTTSTIAGVVLCDTLPTLLTFCYALPQLHFTMMIIHAFRHYPTVYYCTILAISVAPCIYVLLAQVHCIILFFLIKPCWKVTEHGASD